MLNNKAIILLILAFSFVMSLTINAADCSGVPTWDSNKPWYDYVVGEQVVNDSQLFECKNISYSYLEPSSRWGRYGWTNLGECSGSATATPTDPPTATPVGTAVPTATPVPTAAPTATPVGTAVPTATPAPTPAPTDLPSGGGCSAAAWSSSTVYVGGNQVSHNGKLWEAKWWTQGQEPGTTGRWGVWRDLGVCDGSGTNPTPTPVPATPTPAPNTPTPAPVTPAPIPGGSNLINLASGMELTIQFTNSTNGAYADSQIYICIIARNQAHNFSYITPNGSMIPITAGQSSDVWSYRLSDINGFQIPTWAESGRLYMSMGQPVVMTGIVDGAGQIGVVQPDLNNPADPNQGIYFEWMEFTVQPGAFWGNTTQVDQYSFSYTMELFQDSGSSYNSYMKVGITETRNQILNSYESSVPSEFVSLVQRPYRIVAPGKGEFRVGRTYGTYMDSYVNQVWDYYLNNTQTLNHPLGTFSLRSLSDGRFEFRNTSNGSLYYIAGKPNNDEILEGSGVLASGNTVELALQAQMVAALNRHVAANTSLWTNYYAKFWHDHSLMGLAYGFSYDDVAEQAPLIENHAPRGIILDILW